MAKVITGADAIEHAERTQRLPNNQYTTPIEDAREGVDLEEAREIARIDPSLIWISVPA